MESPSNSDILSAMRQGVDYRLEITCRAFKMWVRPLSSYENMLVSQEVADRLLRLPPTHRLPSVEATMRAKITLQTASTSDVGKNDYRLTELEMDRMSSDEIAYLFKQYASACDKVNPSLDTMPREQVEALAEALKKSPSEAIELSFSDLVNIVRYLLTPDASPTVK